MNFGAIVLPLVLSACATAPDGLQMTKDEREACKAQGCTAWTEAELRMLTHAAWREGFKAGVKSEKGAL